MKCLPLYSIKTVAEMTASVVCIQWKSIISNYEHSFNDQPSWVRYNPISRKVISLAWESEDSAIKGQLYRGYNKPYYIRPLDKRIEFDHNSTSNDEILHPDYRNKDFVITYSIGPRRRSTVL